MKLGTERKTNFKDTEHEDEKDEIDALLEKIGSDSLAYGQDVETVALRCELREKGEEAMPILIMKARNAIDSLIDEHTEPEYQKLWAELFRIVNQINICARPNDSADVIGLLKRIYTLTPLTDFSIGYKLLDTIGRIGNDPSIVKELINLFWDARDPHMRSSTEGNYFERYYLSVVISLSEKFELDTYTIRQRFNYSEKIDATKEQIRRKEEYESLFEVSEDDALSTPHEEIREDAKIKRYIDEKRWMEAQARLRTVANLQELDNGNKDEERLQRHSLILKELNPPKELPSVGIEIEVNKKAVLSGKNKGDYTKTEALGLPAGADSFHEFAHAPVNNYLTISREVMALLKAGLLSEEYKKYTLHLSLGDIGYLYREGRSYEDLVILQRILEATAWSTTGRRLLMPSRTQWGAWSKKSAVVVRDHNIHGGKKIISEMRTFEFVTLSGLDRLLRSAQLLGAALWAHEHQEDHSDRASELRKTWEEFKIKVEKIFKNYNILPNNGFNKDWYPGRRLKRKVDYDDEYEIGDEASKSIKENEKTSDYYPMASLLREYEEEKKGEGERFVNEIRQLVIETRAKIAEILEI